jgi:hypothetical protein
MEKRKKRKEKKNKNKKALTFEFVELGSGGR